MSQTKGIKIRLSPIMERMKGSLDKIKSLEVSLEKSSRPEEEKEQDSSRSRSPEEDDDADNNNASARVHAKSRELLTHSMEMLHRKLGRLSQMETDFNAAEDRRQELQHHFLQASLNKPSRELATTRQRNLQLEDQVSQLEEEVHQLGRKCTTVDPLQQRVDSLTEQLQKLENVPIELYESTTKCNLLEKDLEQRQSKLREQSERCDDLECQVKQLTVMCDDLLQTLAAREVQNEVLVEQLRHEQQPEEETFKGGNHKRDNKSSSSSTAEESDDTSSFESGGEHHSIGEINTAHSLSPEEEVTKSPKRFSRLQNLASAVLKGSATPKTQDASSSTRGSSVKGMSIVVQNTALDSSFAMEQQLEAVRVENARLFQSQQDTKNKCMAVEKENTWQSSRIAQLERQLQETERRLSMSSSPSATTMPSPPPETKGFFFRKLLFDSSYGNSQRGPPQAPNKAELVRQGLAGPSNLALPLVEPSEPEVGGTEAPSVATQEEVEDAPLPTLTEAEALQNQETQCQVG
jgi:hypothetical protein